MAVTTAAVPEAPPSMGAFARVVGAIVSPRATFEDIARKPSWLLPLLILVILAVATTAAIGHRVGWRSIIEKQISQNASAQQRMEQLPPEKRDQILAMQAKFAPVFGYAANVIIFPLICLFIAGVMMGTLNATSSAGLDFKTSFGIVTHGYMPGVIGLLLGIVILFLKSPDQIDIQNIVASNAGAFLADNAPRWLVALATSIDIFSFWTVGLIGFGYAVARPKKISVGKGVACMLALWAFYVILKVGLIAITS